LAGAILYGLMRRIRSSRQLEYACQNNLDFLWLVEGRTLDHDTICKFRVKFKEPLKELFKQINRVAMAMGLIRLVEVAFDGTRVKADASRFHTWTAEKLQKVLQELETEIGRMLDESEAADAADATLWGPGEAKELPAELADATKRRERLRQTLEKLHEADAARKEDGINPEKNPAQLPQADPDSRVLPNKEGGYAPNYTPLAATDGTAGFIVDADVIPGPSEQNELLPSMDRIHEDYGPVSREVLGRRGIRHGTEPGGDGNAGDGLLQPGRAPSRSRATPRCGRTRGNRCPRQTGPSCRATTRRSWPSAAFSTIRRRTATGARSAGRWPTTRPRSTTARRDR